LAFSEIYHKAVILFGAANLQVSPLPTKTRKGYRLCHP